MIMVLHKVSGGYEGGCPMWLAAWAQDVIYQSKTLFPYGSLSKPCKSWSQSNICETEPNTS